MVCKTIWRFGILGDLMNDKQVRFLIHCIALAVSAYNPNKRYDAEAYINKKFNELGEENDKE